MEANDAATKILGTDYTGRRLKEIDPNYEKYWFEIFGKVALTGQSIRMEQYAEPDKKWYSFYIFKIGDEKSRRVGNIFLDITARKQEEKELIEAKERLAQSAEEKYRTLFENMNEGFSLNEIILDSDGNACDIRYLAVNPPFEKQTGIQAEHIVGRTSMELFPNAESVWLQQYSKLIQTGEPLQFEERFGPLERDFVVRAYKVGEHQFATVFWDITERKRSEEELRKAHQLNTEILESMTDAFYAVASNWHLTYVNQKTEAFWNKKREDLIGCSLWDNFSEFEKTTGAKELIRAMNERISVCFENFSPYLSSWIESNVYPTSAGGLCVYFRDITERKKMEEELKRQKDQLEAIIENMSDALLIFDRDGNFTIQNKSARETYSPLYGHLEKIGGVEYYDDNDCIIPYEDIPTQRVLRGEKLNGFQMKIAAGDVSVYTNVNATPIYDHDGNFVVGVMSCRDVTQQVKAEEELKSQKNLLETVIENIPDPFAIYNKDGSLMKMNAAGRKLYPKKETTKDADSAHKAFEYFDLDGNKILHENLATRRALRGETVRNDVFVVKRADWQQITEANATPLFDNNKNIVAVLVAHRDITERKNVELELAEAKRMAEKNQLILEAVIQQMPAGIIITDATGSQARNNNEMDRIWRRDMLPEENINHHEYVAYYPDGREYPLDEWPLTRALVNGETTISEEMTILRGDGTKGIVLVSSAPIKDKSGKLIAGVVIDTDITELRKAFEQLEAQKGQLEIIIENMYEGLYITDGNGKIIMMNATAKSQLYKSDEKNVLGDSTRDTQYFDIHGNELSEKDLPSVRALKGEQVNNFQILARRPDKELIFEMNAIPVFDQDEKVVMTITCSHDITALKMAETGLRMQKEQIEAIIENMSDALFVIDNEGVYRKINKAGKELFHSVEINKFGDVYSASKFYDLAGNEMKKEDLPYSYIRQGICLNNQQFIHKHGTETNYISFSGAPLFDEAGKFILGIICARDITETVKNQILIRGQHEKTLQAEKEKNDALKKAIEMKDEFLSLISHEFKTPLTVINSAIQAMEFICKNELSDKARGFLNKIRQNSNRQLKLVNNLLDVTRANAGHLKISKTNIDIVRLTRSITESINTFAIQKSIKLSFTSTLSKKIIGIDEEKYERILLNLLSNAIKFTPEGKSITVKTFQKIVKEKCKVCIQVKDQGVGIPNDKKDLIFERFGQVDSSLTRQAEGTGIGLSLVKMLVELHDGEIILKSKEGVGSTFTILLPIAKVIETLNEQMMIETSDNRLIQATAIEFSDIYM